MSKRMKLNFSIEQILGLQDQLKAAENQLKQEERRLKELATEEELKLKIKSEVETIISSHQNIHRVPTTTTKLRSPTLSSPGSDGFNEYHSDDELNKRKRKRTRTTFSSAQVYELEKKFQRSQYLSAVDRLNLAAALSMSDVQVKRWFQNRRCKERHRMEDLQKIQQTPRSPLLFYNQSYLGATDALILQNHLRNLVQQWTTTAAAAAAAVSATPTTTAVPTSAGAS